MKTSSKIEQIHANVKSNRWFRYFAVLNRIALAMGFIPSGFTKIIGERFTDLHNFHPMGGYLEALHKTGFYYPFIGYIQVLAAILLLIPRTATLGAMIYFPIILNICILSLSVGFDGSLVSSPLMVWANLYLLCWDYDKLKYIMSWNKTSNGLDIKVNTPSNNKFPLKFFIGVVITVYLTGLTVTNAYLKKTRNTLEDCTRDCKKSDDSPECYEFCTCIHENGHTFDFCTRELKKAKKPKDSL